MTVFKHTLLFAAALSCSILSPFVEAAPFDAVVNEMSQGSSGTKEWVEILVTADGLDMRNWDVGDLDDGIWHGNLSFSSASDWSSVARGTIIVVYNGGDVDGTLPVEDTDFGDKIVVIPHNNTTYFSGSWISFGNSDRDDCAAIRDAFDVVVHDMAVTHPSATVTSPQGGNAKYFIEDSIAEIEDNANWTEGDSTTATPGAGNGGNNSTWVSNLCGGIIPTNQPPVIPAVANQSVAESNSLSFVVTANDLTDLDSIVLSGANLPAGSTFPTVTNNGTVMGTFTWNNPTPGGVYSPMFTATDKDGSTSIVVTVTVISPPSGCGVIFSEYIEGSGFNKALEIYNGTDFEIDLASAGYIVELYYNGSATPSQTVNLEGTLRSTETHVLASSQAGATLTALADQVAGISFNGDDAILLRSGGGGGTILDSIGEVGVDPGSAWGTDPERTQDHTLRRKLSIASGDNIINDAFDPATEWDGFDIDDFTNTGDHDNGCGTPAPPESIYSSMSLVGDYNGFDPSTNFMELIDDDTWQITVGGITGTSNLFKFVANADFGAGQWGETNQLDFDVPLNGTADPGGVGVDIQVLGDISGLHRFTFNDQTLDYSIDRAPPNGMAVAASFNGFNSTPNMTFDGTNLWTYSRNFLQATGVQFRFIANGDPNQNWGDTNQNNFVPPLVLTAEPNGTNALIPGPINGVYNFQFNHETLEYEVFQDSTAPIVFVQPFNAWEGAGSYGDYSFQGWDINSCLVDTTKARGGRVCRIRNTTPGADTHFIQSPSNAAGLGSISFWYASWDGSPDITFKIQKSVTGTPGSWTDVETVSGVNNTNYQSQVTLLDDPNSHFVRIYKTTASERLLVDDIFFTSDTNAAFVSISQVKTSPALPYTNDEVAVSAVVDQFGGAENLEVSLFYRVGANTNFIEVAMDNVGNNFFSDDTIPPQPVGTEVFYFIRADFTGPGSSQTSPTFFPDGGGLLSYGISSVEPGRVWINEIDHIASLAPDFTTMSNEFIEIAGPAGADLSRWSIELFNGQETSFQTYDTYNIPTTTLLPDDNMGIGFYVLGMSQVTQRDITLTNFLSNHSPGGIKLLNEFGGVVQSISYGGFIVDDYGFIGTNDPDFFPPQTNSLQLTGTGINTNNLDWVGAGSTPGAINFEQIYLDVPFIDCPPALTVSCLGDVPAADISLVSATGTCGDLTVTITHAGDISNGGAGCLGDPLVLARIYRAVSDCATTNECQQLITVVDDVAPTVTVEISTSPLFDSITWDGGSSDITGLGGNITSTPGSWTATDTAWNTSDEMVDSPGSQADFKAALARVPGQLQVAEINSGSDSIFVGGNEPAGSTTSPYVSLVGFDTTSFNTALALDSITMTIRNRVSTDTMDVRWFVEAAGKTYVSSIVGTPGTSPETLKLLGSGDAGDTICEVPITDGLSLWLDASDIDGDGQLDSLTDGSTITSWQDKSGLNHDADGVLGAPFYVKATAAANFLPAVGFNTGGGADQLFTSYNFDGLGDNHTIFAVSRYTGGSNGRVVTSKNSGPNDNWLFGHHGGRTTAWYAEGWIPSIPAIDNNTDMHLYSGVIGPDINGVVGEFAGDPAADFWRDGVQLANDSQASSNTDYKPGQLALGAWLNGNEASDAEVAEVLIYDRALSNAERLEVETYLALKYGLLSIGPGSTLDLSTFGGLDGGGPRLNIDLTPISLPTGTYEVDQFDFKATLGGNIIPVLAKRTGTGPTTYETVWVGGPVTPSIDGVGRKLFREESFTLASTEDIYAGVYHDGSSKVYTGGGGPTDHDNNTVTVPSFVGQALPGGNGWTVESFSPGYAFNIDVSTSCGSDEDCIQDRILALNPTAYYTFDTEDITGSTVANRGSLPNTASLQGGATFTGTSGGFLGGGLNIDDNSSQRLEVDAGVIDLGTDWTVSAWFLDLHDTSAWRTLIRGSGTDHQIIVGTPGNNNLGTFLNGGGGFHDSGYDLFPGDTTWHHLAAVASGGQTAFYIDGVLVGTSLAASSSDILGIGNFQGGGQPFAQTIDEFAVFDRALNEDEIAELYKADDCESGEAESGGGGDCILGKTIRINNPDSGAQDHIQLAEVQVFSDGENVAINGTASHSSECCGGAPSRANDGNTDGNYSNGSVSHSNNNTPGGEWWQVVLPQEVQIDQIVIWNRTDCCGFRLNNYTVEVLDSSGAVVWSDGPSPTPSPTATHEVSPEDCGSEPAPTEWFNFDPNANIASAIGSSAGFISLRNVDAVGYYTSSSFSQDANWHGAYVDFFSVTALYDPDGAAAVVETTNCQSIIPDLTNLVTATDNCGVLTLTQTPEAGSSAGVGRIPVTVSASDPCGNTSNVVLFVEALDNVPPSITCPPNITTECDLGGNDNASFSAYVAGWTNGTDGGAGIGFAGGWLFSSNGFGNTGVFIGDSRNNGTMADVNADGDVNTVGFRAWGLFANSGGLMEARRPLEILPVGNTVSLEFDNGFLDGGGSAGFSLRTAGGAQSRLDVQFIGGGTNYTLVDSLGTRNTGLAFTDEGILATFTLTTPDNYQLALEPLAVDASVVITGTLAGSSGIPIEELRLFNNNAGGGSGKDAFFNSIRFPSLPPLDFLSIIATDDCSVVTVDHVADVFTNSCPQILLRTYRATDESGNTALCQQTITIQDTRPPNILCLSTGITVLANNDCEGPTPNLLALAFTTDACGSGGISLSQTPTSGTKIPFGTNSVFITATDSCGNSTQCVVFVEVVDQTPPPHYLPCPILLPDGR